jgi:hypothetical protein
MNIKTNRHLKEVLKNQISKSHKIDIKIRIKTIQKGKCSRIALIKETRSSNLKLNQQQQKTKAKAVL